MASTHRQQEGGIKSTASIKGHPLHPMLIPFPIAFLVGAFLTDLTYWQTGNIFWTQASHWLIVGGALSGALAAIFGLTDFITLPQVREHRIAWYHFLGNATVLVLALINWWLRLGDPAANLLPWGLLLSAIVTAILLMTGWYGGELVFRHKIGVVGDESEQK